MTEEREKEATGLIEEMFSAPAMQQYIHTMPSGQRVITIESAAGMMLALLESTDEAMEQVLQMIKGATP